MAPGATEQAGHNNGPECRVTVPAGAAEADAEHENAKGGGRRAFCAPAWLFSWMAAPRDRVAGFAKMVWRIGADDPRKVVHGLKMALALTLCSVFYYVRPLYVFTSGNAMWAVLTVVVVFEYTVGGCLYKGLNRAVATVIGGALALGVQWIASKPGKEFEPFILSGSLFVLAAAATFSRFIPTLKARFDYGVTIFILTYSLVAVTGYRVDAVVGMALQRLTTIAIGAFICFAVCVLIFPVWAGQELHVLVTRNMDKLAAAVEGCVDDYFSESVVDAATGERPARLPLSEKSQGYKFVLNAKASEDSMANLARWEPGHGMFGFWHPYGQYQKVGAAMRCCAYCVDALAACVRSEAQTPAHVKKHLAGAGAALSRHCAAVLREASVSVTSMTRSGRLALVVGDMNAAAQELRDELRCLATILEEEESSYIEHEQNIATLPPPLAATTPAPPLIEALPLFTAASLLLEICARVEGVVGAVDALAMSARFRKADDDEMTTLDVEASMSISKSNPLSADASHETHAKVVSEQEKAETADQANASSGHEPRDQVGQLIKVLTRRRSTKKWARGQPKVVPKAPLDFAVHAPSPRNRSTEFAGHGPVAPSPRNRALEFASHAPVAPSPRSRSMDLTNHGPAMPSPRFRSILGMA